MTLGIVFCQEVMKCDQVRRPEDEFTTCNLSQSIVYGMEFSDCPKVQQELAKARTEGRQEATAELDRSAGQPLQTYVQKQSLVQILTTFGCGCNESEQRALHAGADTLALVRREQVKLINQILKSVVAGTQLKEVEL